MPKFEACRQYLQQHLSVDRYSHSLGVWREMERVAPIYGLEVEAARWAGLMHDVAKEVPDHELTRLLHKFFPAALEALPEKYRVNTYLHGPAGAVLLRKLWEHPDTNVILAVEQHAGNYRDMPLLSRCLHIADLVAPVYRYPGCPKLEREFLRGNLDGAELLADTWCIEYYLEKGIPVHPAYQEKIRRLSAILKPTRDFLARET